jgi:hypothetical protein
MTNSPIEIADAVTVVGKLVDRTREGKLVWQTDGIHYTTTFGPNLRARVSDSNAFDFSLVEFDPRSGATWASAILGDEPSVPDKEVLNVSVERDPAYGYDTIEEKGLAELLRDMVVLARRSALDVNSSVQKALTYLDKIAG